ncbi:hypothetical protein C3747_118g78 [Trypanosoma cruzi]|uniref:Chorein N-terminal domain-containing protein n=3 Tax=Trypanosoma cruzi TaxID=5693 RepID=A0A2V2WD91_TRYCR|nr:hypothetical protein C3747_118g78 [Trypanosoma cruzi]
MFIANYISSWLSTYIRWFTKHWNRNSISVSILKGCIELKDIELNADITAFFRASIPLERASVGRLRLTVPWTALYSCQCELFLEDVLAVFKHHFQEEVADDEGNPLEGKKRIVELLDAIRYKSQGNTETKRQGFLERLKWVIFRNMKVVFKNFAVRYELIGTSSLNATIRLQYLSCIAANAMNEPFFVTDDECDLYRIILFQGLSFTVASLDCIETSNRSWRMGSLHSFTSFLIKGMEKEVEKFGYVLKPSSGRAFGSLQFQPPKLQLGTFVLVHDCGIDLDLKKIQGLLKMTSYVVSFWPCDKDEKKLRPIEKPSTVIPGSCAAWWRYSIDRIISNTRGCVKRTAFHWATYQEWKCHSEEYYKHYLLTLGAPWLFGLDVNKTILEEALSSFSIGYLIQIRQEARFTLEEFRLTGRVFPRHYGDTISDRGFGYKVAVVEVLKGSVVDSPMQLEVSISLGVPKLPLFFRGHNMHFNIDLTDMSLRVSRSADLLQILFSAYSIQAFSEVSGFNRVDTVFIIDGTKTTKGVVVTYLRNGKNKDLSFILTSFKIRYNQCIAGKLIAEFYMLESENALGWDNFVVYSLHDVAYPLKTQVNIGNTALKLGKLEVCFEDLSFEVQWTCSRLFVSEISNSPFIDLKNVFLPYTTDSSIFIEESYICGDLSSFYLLKSMIQDMMVIYEPIIYWLRKRDTIYSTETMNIFELESPFFMVTLPGEGTFLKIRQFAIHLSVGPTWILRASCIGMACDGVLSDTNMRLMVLGGTNRKEIFLDGPLKNSDGDLIVSATFEEGHIIVDNRLVGLVEFLNDLLFVMLFPAEINSPVFFDESVMIPSLEVLISCSNLSFDVLGESSGTWNLPLRFSCNGQESLLVEFKRFPDTHMNTTVTFGRCFLCSVDEFTLILPSYSNKGVLQLVMDWRPPMDLVKEEKYSTLTASLFVVERYFTFHLPAIHEFLHQFNRNGSALYRLRSLGSRLHFGLREPNKGVYSVPLWPHRTIIKLDAKNIMMFYHPWYKKDLSDLSSNMEFFVRTSFSSCKANWSFDGFKGHILMEVFLITGLPRVMKSSCSCASNVLSNNNVLLVELRQDVTYDLEKQKEAFSIVMKGKDMMEIPQMFTTPIGAKPSSCAAHMMPFMVSFEEANEFIEIVNAAFDFSLPQQVTVETSPRQERVLKINVAPFLVCSPSLFDVAFVSWEGIDFMLQKDGNFEGNTVGISLLYDASLRAIENQEMTVLWDHLHRVKKATAILEVLGNQDTEGDFITLKKKSDMDCVMLHIGGVFLHITEKKLPLLLHQFMEVHNFFCSNILPLPLLPRENVIATSELNYALMNIQFDEVHLGFRWNSRMNGIYGELHCALFAFTWRSNGALTLKDGVMQLKWFDAAPLGESMGSVDLLLQEASETVPLIEHISLSTEESRLGKILVKISPIHMNLAFDTYLSLVELVGYHLRLELRRPARGTSVDFVSVETLGKGALDMKKSLSSASYLFSCGNGDTLTSFSGAGFLVQSVEVTPTWQFSLELAKVRLTVDTERRVKNADKKNFKPLLWLNLTNIIFDLFPNGTSFALDEVRLSCLRETSVVSLSGLQFSTSRASDSMHSVPEMVCMVQSIITRLFTPDLLTCFDRLIKTPAEELAELYWETTHPSGSDILCRFHTEDSTRGDGSNGDNRSESKKGNYRKMEVLTVGTPVWELTNDLVLSRNGGTVLQFSNVNTNNIHVEMNGHSILIETPRKAGAEIVMVVDGGISLTFCNGRFVLPCLLSEETRMRRLERLGEEALLLPFIALGECSYIRCFKVRYATTERHNLQHFYHHEEQKQQQEDGAIETVRPQRWKMHAGIHSVILHVSSERKKGIVKATVAVEAKISLHGKTIERGEISLENFSVVTRTMDSTTTNTTSTTTTAVSRSSSPKSNSNMSASAMDNVLIAPVSIHLCISESRQFAFSLGRVVVDAMVGDLLLLSIMARELFLFARHVISFQLAPTEQEYRLQIEHVLGWNSAGMRGDQHEEGGDARQRGEAPNEEPTNTMPVLSLALFLPMMEVTLSNLKYPLVQLSLADIVWKVNMFCTSRTTLLQSQQLNIQVYGKGRWDTVIPPKAVISLEAVHSWSRRTRTEQVELQCDGLVLYASHLLLSKMMHIHREWSEFYSTIFELSHHAEEASPPMGLSNILNPVSTATHRFINVFDDVFYLFVGKDLENGEIVPLPSCTAVDLTLPFNRAEDVRLYLYPRHCIELNENGRHVRNNEGLRRDMQHCHVVASQLQYGRAFGLVLDDLLVVISCVETEGIQKGMPPLSSVNARCYQHADRGTTPLTLTNQANVLPPFRKLPMASFGGIDEAGLVIVRIHSRRALYNGIGMMIEVRQYILADSEETPMSEDFWIVPPNAEYPLVALCNRLELRFSLDGDVYGTSFRTLSLETGVVLAFQRIGNEVSNRENSGFLPVSVFIALRHFPESGSTVIHLLPRMTVLNHIGVPIKLSLWQEEGTEEEKEEEGLLLNHRDDSVSSTSNHGERGSSITANSGQPSSQRPDWRRRSSRRRLISIGEHGALPHQGALSICRCSYSSGLLLSLTFTQTGGETVQTERTTKVCSSLKRRVGREPCLMRLRDSSKRSFYVQVTVLHRTIILSVGYWVINLTEYPILLKDSYTSRHLTAGQSMNTGIPPSQGLPFLIGSRPAEFTVALLKIGLDEEWSEGIPTQVGSHGVAESPRRMVGGVTRSCNYVIQFPRVQEGRPAVLLLTPRWVFINNANRRLKVHFTFPVVKKRLSLKKLSSREQRSPRASEADTDSLPFLTLRPGEHQFSCIGTATGNMASFQDTLEDAVPSVTSLFSDTVRHKNLAEFYEAHRTASISVDGPGHAVFNLWASLKRQPAVPSVFYGARIANHRSSSLLPQSSSDCFEFDEDVAFVTGRISVTVQHIDNVLAVVINSIHSTNMVIQNRARSVTLAVRQKGSQRRTVIPPCQNRFFLWEDYRTDPVISLHVIGFKGAWFEVDFSRGSCQVQRRHTSDLTENVLSPFSFRACISTRNAQRVTILFTDENFPPHTSFDDAWHRSVGRTISFPSLELLWLMEEQSTGDKPHLSLVLRDLQVQTLVAGNTHAISIILKRLQVVDVRRQAIVVLHRANPATSNATEVSTGGRILSWLWRGEEVPQQDFQAVYAAMMSPSGVTRVTELSFVFTPFVLNLSDQLVVSLWQEYRGLFSFLKNNGSKTTLVSEALSSTPLSHHEFSQRLMARMQEPENCTTEISVGNTSLTSSSAIPSVNYFNQSETHEGPALLFIDQAHFSRLTVFLTFSRQKPDLLWELLGMYTLMIPKRLEQKEFSWNALVVENGTTTWGLLLAQAQRWLMDGALRQWPKVTRLGDIVDTFKRGSNRRVTLAGTPAPRLADVNNFSDSDDDKKGKDKRENEALSSSRRML